MLWSVFNRILLFTIGWKFYDISFSVFGRISKTFSWSVDCWVEHLSRRLYFSVWLVFPFGAYSVAPPLPGLNLIHQGNVQSQKQKESAGPLLIILKLELKELSGCGVHHQILSNLQTVHSSWANLCAKCQPKYWWTFIVSMLCSCLISVALLFSFSWGNLILDWWVVNIMNYLLILL